MAEETASNEKIQEALELLSEAAKEKKEELRQLLSGKYSDLRQCVKEAEFTLQDRLAAAMESAARAKEAGTMRAKEAISAVERKVQAEPWKMLAYTAAAGFLIGYLLGRRNDD